MCTNACSGTCTHARSVSGQAQNGLTKVPSSCPWLFAECMAAPHAVHAVICIIASATFAGVTFLLVLADHDLNPMARSLLASPQSITELKVGPCRPRPEPHGLPAAGQSAVHHTAQGELPVARREKVLKLHQTNANCSFSSQCLCCGAGAAVDRCHRPTLADSYDGKCGPIRGK